MKRASRIIIRVSCGLIIAVVVLLIFTLDSLDYRPYMTAPYYLETRERWLNQSTNLALVYGPLEVGFGLSRLTPVIQAQATDATNGRFQSIPLAGYGNRHGKPAQGVHEDVFVKAVAFRVKKTMGVMVSADALIIPREVAQMASEKLKNDLGRDQIYFGATHTHASLGGWGEGFVAEQFAGPYQPAVRTWFAGCLVDAVKKALSDLKPSTAGHGKVAVPQHVRNRLIGNLGRVDPDFSFLYLKQLDGQSAIIGSYSAHATVLSSSVMDFSGDYPGAWQRAMEKLTGGMAMFFAGGVGSHSPVAVGKGYEGADNIGRNLADAVMRLLPQVTMTNAVVMGMTGLDLKMPELHLRITDGTRLRPWVSRKLLPVGDHSFIQVLRIDQSSWVSTPCDFSGELALDIKECSRSRGFETVVTSFNGDYIGYIIPQRYYHLDGYEPRLMSFFGPNMPEYITEMIREMLIQINRPIVN